MKRPIYVLLLLCLLVLGIFQSADSTAASQFKSSKPLFARVAVTQDGSKVLSVAFDESRGTGRGYDTICADTNFNGRFDDSERLESRSAMAVFRFRRVRLSVPFYSNGRISIPRVYQFTRTTNGLDPQGRPYEERFAVDAFFPLNGGSTESLSSCCHLQADLKPCASLAGAEIAGFGHKPRTEVTANPGPKKQGSTAIGISVVMGDWRTCGGQQQMPTTLVITDSAGKVVHRGAATLGKFSLG